MLYDFEWSWHSFRIAANELNECVLEIYSFCTRTFEYFYLKLSALSFIQILNNNTLENNDFLREFAIFTSGKLWLHFLGKYWEGLYNSNRWKLRFSQSLGVFPWITLVYWRILGPMREKVWEWQNKIKRKMNCFSFYKNFLDFIFFSTTNLQILVFDKFLSKKKYNRKLKIQNDFPTIQEEKFL